eukprot:3487625-Pleurochrysis_carterae.AAC.1
MRVLSSPRRACLLDELEPTGSAEASTQMSDEDDDSGKALVRAAATSSRSARRPSSAQRESLNYAKRFKESLSCLDHLDEATTLVSPTDSETSAHSPTRYVLATSHNAGTYSPDALILRVSALHGRDGRAKASAEAVPSGRHCR